MDSSDLATGQAGSFPACKNGSLPPAQVLATADITIPSTLQSYAEAIGLIHGSLDSHISLIVPLFHWVVKILPRSITKIRNKMVCFCAPDADRKLIPGPASVRFFILICKSVYFFVML